MVDNDDGGIDNLSNSEDSSLQKGGAVWDIARL